MLKIFNSDNNKLKLFNAAIKMIEDYFVDITIDKTELNNILSSIMNNISIDNNINDINQLNKLSLINIKKYYDDKKNNDNKPKIIKIENELLDNDIINIKLKELEKTRRIMPNISISSSSSQNIQNYPIQHQNNQQQPHFLVNDKNDKIYRNFIINSNTRDWFVNNNRNNLSYNIPFETKNNEIYPVCLCLIYKIKNITPYIILNISDGIKNINYTFVCDKINSNWDLWKPSCDNIEPIELNNKFWKLSFFDYNNKLLDIGYDGFDIINVKKCDNKYLLNISDNKIFKNDDNIIIRTYKGIYLNKKIEVKDNYMYISDDNINSIDDFRNSKVLDCMEQYSFIIKYTTKLY